MMAKTLRVLDGKMISINWKTIAILVHIIRYLAQAHHEAPQSEDSIYQQGNFALNTGQYIKREFHYSPEQDNWQRKFAETISKAVEEDTKATDYSNPNSGDLHHFHKETSETGSDYENRSSPGHTYISPPVDPHVSVTREEATCSNESFTQRPGNYEVKTGVVNVPSNNPDQQYSHNEKGEILIHRPAPIIVNRPPTKVVVSHAPLIVRPAPVIFHRPPSVIVRQVFVKPRTEPAKMQPVFVKVIRPPPEKIFINDHVPCGDCHMNADCTSRRNHRHYKCPYQS